MYWVYEHEHHRNPVLMQQIEAALDKEDVEFFKRLTEAIEIARPATRSGLTSTTSGSIFIRLQNRPTGPISHMGPI